MTQGQIMLFAAGAMFNQHEADKTTKPGRRAGAPARASNENTHEIHKPPIPFKQMKSAQEYENYLQSTGVF